MTGSAGLYTFSGKFRRCFFGCTSYSLKQVPTQDMCDAQLGIWKNPHFHFDNLGAAILTLLEVSRSDRYF